MRPIDANNLLGDLIKGRERLSCMDEHALRDVMTKVSRAPTLSLNTLRDAIYEDAVAHGLWEATDREARELTEDVMPNDRKYYEAAFKMIRAVQLVLDESDELVSAAHNESIDSVIEELADVVIQAFSTAGYLGIDIDAAIRRKMKINKKRPWKHGKE